MKYRYGFFCNCLANPKFHFVLKTGVISTRIVLEFYKVDTLGMATKALKITTILKLSWHYHQNQTSVGLIYMYFLHRIKWVKTATCGIYDMRRWTSPLLLIHTPERRGGDKVRRVITSPGRAKLALIVTWLIPNLKLLIKQSLV